MNVRDDKVRQILEKTVSSKVLYHESTERHTSIGVGGRTDALVYPHSRSELRQLISCLRSCEIPFLPVGNWTNIIVKDGGYRGVIISLKCLNHVTWEKRDADHVSICAEAGVAISDIVRLSACESLAGIEFCAGIPGSVGGAVRMNAGAYGSEIKDVIECISVMNINGDILEFKGTELTFEYRNLVLPDGAIVVSASFLLTRGIKENIQKRIQEIIEIRKKKHPLEHRNAGSVFKNPKGLPAGQIIDELNLKGIQIGGAKISEKHGNFIVNMGGAKTGDILALIDTVKKKVWEDRGIHLEPEIIIIGEDE